MGGGGCLVSQSKQSQLLLSQVSGGLRMVYHVGCGWFNAANTEFCVAQSPHTRARMCMFAYTSTHRHTGTQQHLCLNRQVTDWWADLRERLEDALLLGGGDADAGVDYLEAQGQLLAAFWLVHGGETPRQGENHRSWGIPMHHAAARHASLW